MFLISSSDVHCATPGCYICSLNAIFSGRNRLKLVMTDSIVHLYSVSNMLDLGFCHLHLAGSGSAHTMSLDADPLTAHLGERIMYAGTID